MKEIKFIWLLLHLFVVVNRTKHFPAARDKVANIMQN